MTKTQSEIEHQSSVIIESAIRKIENFPIEGVIFKDITTLLNDGAAFLALMQYLESRYKDMPIKYIAGLDARGFIFGAALATRLGIGFVPIRKKGKLPCETHSQSYELEYGTDSIEIHKDAFRNEIQPDVLLIDDLIATGGTAVAAAQLIEKANGNLVEACFVLSVKELQGIQKLSEYCSNIHIVCE